MPARHDDALCSAVPVQTTNVVVVVQHRYSCLDVLGVLPVTELVMATRARNPSPGTVEAMEEKAHSLGVPFASDKVDHVNWTVCKY